jgi:protein-disulfide isomerase
MWILTGLMILALGVGPVAAVADPERVRPVSGRDHIRGDPQAPVKLVEFSDTECPLCKRFHPTLRRLVADNPGKVAWVYRHFPIDAVHPLARREAEATECAAELGGNDRFWAYLDRLFEITPSNDELDPAELPRIAQHVGLAREPFVQCLQSGRHAARVEEDYQDALAAGGPGTPYSIMIARNGRKFPVVGAQPDTSMELLLEIALTEN